MNRRMFFSSLAGIIAAPSIVSAASLMPVKVWSDISAYGWIDGSVKKIGDYCVGESISYPHAFLATGKSLSGIKAYLNRVEVWDELIKLRSSASKCEPHTFTNLDITPYATLWHPERS